MDGDDRTKSNGSNETSHTHPAPGTKKRGKGASQAPPSDDGILWGPLPGGGFRFSDHPTAEEFRAYAEWDPNIKQEVEEKFLELALQRARDDAMADVYRRVAPEPPDLARSPSPRTRDETALALGRLVADTQEAVDYLLALGRNRHNDVGPRVQALTAVTRTGMAASKLGEMIDKLFRPVAAPRARRTTRKGSKS
jgi:hypothetical protein